MEPTELEHLKLALSRGIVRIVFEKKDGSLREMNATLSQTIVPAYEKKTDKVKAKNDDVLSVFDTDLNEWRSFRIESLREVNINI